MLPPQTPLGRSSAPRCPAAPGGGHTSRTSLQPAPSDRPGSAAAGKRAGLSQAPRPANIWPRTSARSLCRPAPGRPRTHLPPPAAPAPSALRSPGAFPAPPPPPAGLGSQGSSAGSRGRPSAPRGGSRRRAPPRGGAQCPGMPFRGSAPRTKRGCRAPAHPAGPKLSGELPRQTAPAPPGPVRPACRRRRSRGCPRLPRAPPRLWPRDLSPRWKCPFCSEMPFSRC